MTPAMLIHWLPRVADHLIVFLTAASDARHEGDLAAAADNAESATDIAALAWKSIDRARRVARTPLPKPKVRSTPRHNDIHLHKTRLTDHPAMPPRRARPIRP